MLPGIETQEEKAVLGQLQDLVEKLDRTGKLNPLPSNEFKEQLKTTLSNATRIRIQSEEKLKGLSR